jgi:uncharacterized membrane protein YhaH (DUF805 family)
LELGGVPIATAISLHAGLPLAFVRKEPKTLGTKKVAGGADLDGKHVCLIEDIISTGGAVIDSVGDWRPFSFGRDGFYWRCKSFSFIGLLCLGSALGIAIARARNRKISGAAGFILIVVFYFVTEIKDMNAVYYDFISGWHLYHTVLGICVLFFLGLLFIGQKDKNALDIKPELDADFDPERF